jgi:Tfp pilus assembly protein PilZ
MTRTLDFSDLSLRDVVAINLGVGANWTSLSAIIVATSAHHLELALARAPSRPALLAPGATVRIRRGAESSIRVQVIAAAQVPTFVIAVRPLAATEAARNHRAYHRAPVHLTPVTLVARSVGRTVGVQGWVTDLSGGGARLTVSLALQVGDPLALWLALSDGERRSEVHTEVVWVQPLQSSYQIGVRFVDLPDAFRDRIVHVVFRAELALRQLGV